MDIGLFESLNRNQRRNGLITILDLIMVNDFLDALLYEKSFRVDMEDIDPDEMTIYVQVDNGNEIVDVIYN